MVENISYL